MSTRRSWTRCHRAGADVKAGLLGAVGQRSALKAVAEAGVDQTEH